MSVGSVEPLKKLYREFGSEVEFLDVLIRQAHPGPDVEPYRTFDDKLEDGLRYVEEEGIPWTVLVDDLEGTVHRMYGQLSDPTYVIDRDGRVAFYDIWTHGGTLRLVLRELLDQAGRGVVKDGVSKKPQLIPVLRHGWRGLRRGLPTSLIDLEKAGPGLGVSTFLGYHAGKLLALGLLVAAVKYRKSASPRRRKRAA